jgi:signal transduction histidine kinase
MEEVFSNFIINAIEAMLPKGGGLLEISTADLTPGPSPQACGEGRRMVGIKISDTGIGIPPDKLPMIFKRGYTDKAKGSGNGLYIAKKHIDGLGGGIDVESEVGKGTTFTVILPLYSPLPRMER